MAPASHANNRGEYKISKVEYAKVTLKKTLNAFFSKLLFSN